VARRGLNGLAQDRLGIRQVAELEVDHAAQEHGIDISHGQQAIVGTIQSFGRGRVVSHVEFGSGAQPDQVHIVGLFFEQRINKLPGKLELMRFHVVTGQPFLQRLVRIVRISACQQLDKRQPIRT
jgi:hypothetical protein